MARDGISCDERRWPIVVFTTVGIPSDEQVDHFIERANACLDRGVPYVVVFDNSRGGRATAYMRKLAGAWLRENSDRLGQHCLGTGLVFRSAALRFVMSTVMLVVPHPVPHEVCGTLDQAIAWGERRLEAERRKAG